MSRRSTSVVAALTLLAIAVPTGTAHAGTSDRECTKLVRSPSPSGALPVSPYVIYQETEGSPDFTVLWIDAAGGGTDNTLTSCTFHDADRDGRHDRSERVFAVHQSFSVEPEYVFSKWPYSVVLDGVAQGEQICTKRTLRSKPMSGGRPTTSTSALTCVPVDFTFNG